MTAHAKQQQARRRKIVSTAFITADGVIHEPQHWQGPYWSDEMGAIIAEQLADMDGLLLGRVTYEGFATSWPNMPDTPGASEMNGKPKYVLSTTLTTADWNNSTLIASDFTEEVRRLKQQGGGPLVVWGSGALVRWLLAEGLLDEMHLFVHPIVVGEGSRLFEDAPRTPLRVAESRPLDHGVQYIVYAPVACESAAKE